tara:strand:- start:2021 stop:2839 length:819 start_codon:yes stop_codon:yes gene_type:complete
MAKKKHYKLIAEIGWNFLGNISLAKKMILSAKKSGADYVKFQIWNPKNLKPGKWDLDGRRQIYNKAFLDQTKFKILYDYSKKIRIDCFASVFSENDLAVYSKITKKIIKIPSHESYNLPLIKKSIDIFKTVIISCGCMKETELKKLIKTVKNKNNVILMHCVSSYPLSEENCNFEKFNFLKKKFRQVGYSGHLKGITDAMYAISQGSVLTEKHFTIDRGLEGRDNKFAILPDEMRMLSNYSKTLENFKKNKGLGLQRCEMDIYKNYRGRWQK